MRKDCTHLAPLCRLLGYYLNTKKCILFNSTTATTTVLDAPLYGQHLIFMKRANIWQNTTFSTSFSHLCTELQCVQTEANEANKLLSTVWTANDNDYRRNILTRWLQLNKNVYLQKRRQFAMPTFYLLSLTDKSDKHKKHFKSCLNYDNALRLRLI